MIKFLSCDNPEDIKSLLKREDQKEAKVDDIVAAILDDVKSNGDEAVFKYNLKFDKSDLTSLEVTKEEKERALRDSGEGFISILKEAAENIRIYHEKQKNSGYMISEKPGIMLGQKITSLDRVGIYVPGGTAVYPSSVLMNAIPAKIAGVKEIVMVTPPQPDGSINSDILSAASVAGVDKIYKVGGAQAVAALAFGTESIPAVDKIVGPGNIYVATAKQMVFGKVDIDMIAGPSEILVIADENANPAHTAMDLLSQAEHDTLAASFLVTDSKEFGKKVEKELEKQLAKLSRKEIAEISLKNNGAIVVTRNLEKAAEISNNIAPEHLVINTKDPFGLLSFIRHAGSIFLGAYSPEALGDYFAGPNHILPTSGTARFSSGLSVEDFTKKSSIIYYDKEALKKVGNKVATFAMREGLEAHAKSVTIRIEEAEM